MTTTMHWLNRPCLQHDYAVCAHTSPFGLMKRQGWSMSSRRAAHFLLCARPQYAHFQRRSASFRIR